MIVVRESVVTPLFVLKFRVSSNGMTPLVNWTRAALVAGTPTLSEKKCGPVTAQVYVAVAPLKLAPSKKIIN